VVGAVSGFLAQESIPSGTTAPVRNLLDAGPFAGSQVPKDWAIQVNRFWIDYLPDGNIDQFYSDLSIVDETGEERDRATISVNHPLRYNGVTLYQTSWGIAGVKIQLNNSPILQLPMGQLKTENPGQFWGTWVPLKPDLSEGVSLIARDLQGLVLLYDQQGSPIGAVREGMSIQLGDVALKIVEVVGSTGLQIKADPGVPLVYSGFGILMIGVVMSYFSHSQIWVLQTSDRVYIGGKTNRAKITFERELLDICATARSAVSA
jgi:cytochrome c biogenesis protein